MDTNGGQSSRTCLRSSSSSSNNNNNSIHRTSNARECQSNNSLQINQEIMPRGLHSLSEKKQMQNISFNNNYDGFMHNHRAMKHLRTPCSTYLSPSEAQHSNHQLSPLRALLDGSTIQTTISNNESIISTVQQLQQKYLRTRSNEKDAMIQKKHSLFQQHQQNQPLSFLSQIHSANKNYPGNSNKNFNAAAAAALHSSQNINLHNFSYDKKQPQIPLTSHALSNPRINNSKPGLNQNQLQFPTNSLRNQTQNIFSSFTEVVNNSSGRNQGNINKVISNFENTSRKSQHINKTVYTGSATIGVTSQERNRSSSQSSSSQKPSKIAAATKLHQEQRQLPPFFTQTPTRNTNHPRLNTSNESKALSMNLSSQIGGTTTPILSSFLMTPLTKIYLLNRIHDSADVKREIITFDFAPFVRSNFSKTILNCPITGESIIDADILQRVHPYILQVLQNPEFQIQKGDKERITINSKKDLPKSKKDLLFLIDSFQVEAITEKRFFEIIAFLFVPTSEYRNQILNDAIAAINQKVERSGRRNVIPIESLFDAEGTIVTDVLCLPYPPLILLAGDTAGILHKLPILRETELGISHKSTNRTSSTNKQEQQQQQQQLRPLLLKEAMQFTQRSYQHQKYEQQPKKLADSKQSAATQHIVSKFYCDTPQKQQQSHSPRNVSPENESISSKVSLFSNGKYRVTRNHNARSRIKASLLAANHFSHNQDPINHIFSIQQQQQQQQQQQESQYEQSIQNESVLSNISDKKREGGGYNNSGVAAAPAAPVGMFRGRGMFSPNHRKAGDSIMNTHEIDAVVAKYPSYLTRQDVVRYHTEFESLKLMHASNSLELTINQIKALDFFVFCTNFNVTQHVQGIISSILHAIHVNFSVEGVEEATLNWKKFVLLRTLVEQKAEDKSVIDLFERVFDPSRLGQIARSKYFKVLDTSEELVSKEGIEAKMYVHQTWNYFATHGFVGEEKELKIREIVQNAETHIFTIKYLMHWILNNFDESTELETALYPPYYFQSTNQKSEELTQQQALMLCWDLQ